MQFSQALAVESWTLYSIGILIIAARIASQCIRTRSFTNLQIEDYMMLFVAGNYTADMWAINEVALNGSNYMAPEVAAALSPDGLRRAIWGSKMTLALEMFTLTTEWIAKCCLVVTYHRLTFGLGKLHLFVKLTGAYCVISYVLVTILCLTVWCSPINEYWRVPVKYSQCATYYNHMIFATAMNISSDLMLIGISVPLIIRVKLPFRRKAILGCILFLGIFNILTTTLNRYFNFANPDDLTYLNWYVGEVSTAVCVANIPLTWPVVRKVFGLRPWWGEAVGIENIHQSYNTSNSQRVHRRRSPDASILALDDTISKFPKTMNSETEGNLQLDPTDDEKEYITSVKASTTANVTGGSEMDQRGIVRTLEVKQCVM